jgi:hypothetical protein
MTYMADLMKHDNKRAKDLFTAVVTALNAASGSGYEAWPRPWPTPVRLSGVDWRVVLQKKDDLLRDLLLFWELHARNSLPLTDSLTHGADLNGTFFVVFLFDSERFQVLRRRRMTTWR